MKAGIEHGAVVEHTGPGWVGVVMHPGGTCEGCAAEYACAPGGPVAGERRITIHTAAAADYATGERVTVRAERLAPPGAIAAYYVIPALLALAMLLGLFALGVAQTVAGLSALGMLGVYYIVAALWRRRRVARDFVFSIHKT